MFSRWQTQVEKCCTCLFVHLRFFFLQVFCAELPVFLRESRSRLYRTDTYFLGKSLAELPLFLLVPFIFTSIAYPMIGLQPSIVKYLIAVGIVALVANVATSFGKFGSNLLIAQASTLIHSHFLQDI